MNPDGLVPDSALDHTSTAQPCTMVVKAGPLFCRSWEHVPSSTYLFILKYSAPLMSGNKHIYFTFFGEKFLGIFSCHDKLARHLPQKFYDQCNVICRFQTFQERGKKDIHNRSNECSSGRRQKESHAHLFIQHFRLAFCPTWERTLSI